MEIDKQYDLEWGNPESKWTNKKVEEFVKTQLKSIINELNNIKNNIKLAKLDIIPVSLSSRSALFSRSKPVVASVPSSKSSMDSDVYTVVIEEGYSNSIKSGIYLYDEEDGKLYTEWEDSEDFILEECQCIPGKFYRTEDFEMFYASSYGIRGVSPSIEVDNFITDLQNYSTKLNALESKLNPYPMLNTATPGVTYGLKDGKLEEICGDGEYIWVGNNA